MPGTLLHRGATVVCTHQGTAQPSPTDLHVKVGGQAVVTILSRYTISGCTLPPPPNGNGPCATAPQWTNAAQRVKASGSQVLLSDSKATCLPTGTPLQIQTTQQRVKGT
jgi:Domain of unknown function (DUF4280)